MLYLRLPASSDDNMHMHILMHMSCRTNVSGILSILHKFFNRHTLRRNKAVLIGQQVNPIDATLNLTAWSICTKAQLLT